MDYSLILMFAVVIVIVLPALLCLYDKVFGTQYSCKAFGWHNGNGSTEKTFDGASLHAICSKCDKEVMQDSQGGWF